MLCVNEFARFGMHIACFCLCMLLSCECVDV